MYNDEDSEFSRGWWAYHEEYSKPHEDEMRRLTTTIERLKARLRVEGEKDDPPTEDKPRSSQEDQGLPFLEKE